MDDRRHSWDEREQTWRTWMVAAQAGDGDAYEKLLLELLPHARRQVGWQIGDAPGREDIVQSALVSIHRARHTYRAERPFTPWFHAIVRNATTDWAGARARLSAQEVSLELEAVERIHIEGLSVVEAAARAGVSADGLEVRAHRGYRALRASLRVRDE